MLKPSSLDLSKFAQLKTKFLTLIKDKGPLPLIIAGVALVAIVTTFSLAIVYHHAPDSNDTIADQNPDNPPDSSQNSAGSPQGSQDHDIQPPETPTFIDLQPTVNAWLKTTSADVGLVIYDLDNNRVAASFQPDRVFNVASIYKLFFVYDGYRQIETGAIAASARYVTTSDYRADTYTYGECLNLMIRESYNGCADKMRSDKTAYARVVDLIDELGLENTTSAGLSSTAADLTELLKLYYEHPDLSDASWQKISDSMLNQPATKIDATTAYNWRQGLPSGFSERTKVYDKVGWDWNETSKVWNTYADATIVEFPEQNRHYTIVVLTSGLTNRSAAPIANLGTRIEDAILSADNRL